MHDGQYKLTWSRVCDQAVRMNSDNEGIVFDYSTQAFDQGFVAF